MADTEEVSPLNIEAFTRSLIETASRTRTTKKRPVKAHIEPVRPEQDEKTDQLVSKYFYEL